MSILKKKTIEEMTFEELAEYAALQIHSALLEGGGKAMKGAVHLWLGQTILWSKLKKNVYS